MKQYTLNMLSHADRVKGQGVLSAYEEELNLVRGRLDGDDFRVRMTVNKRYPADITHIHTLNPEFLMQLPMLKNKGITVASVHFLPETVEQSLNLPPLCRKVFYDYMILFYKSVDYLMTVNPSFIPKLEHYGIDPKKVTYIPNYVSGKQFFSANGEEKERLRRKYRLDEKKFTVVCAGQLQTRKGVPEYAALAQALPQMQFVWAGDFAFGNMSEGRKEIERLIANPPKNLTFTGFIPRERMPEIYRMGDVMLLPSFEELFPMTVLEAMSCSVPVLLRDLELYHSILDGYYLKASDNNEFVRQLILLSRQEQYYRTALEMSQKGSQFYSEQHVLSMWREFYHRLLRKGEERRGKKQNVIQFAGGAR